MTKYRLRVVESLLAELLKWDLESLYAAGTGSRRTMAARRMLGPRQGIVGAPVPVYHLAVWYTAEMKKKV